MRINRDIDAVSEIIGAVLLLAIIVCFISSLYITILSDTGPITAPNTTIVGKINNGDVFFDHRSGESLSLDTEIILNIAEYRQLRLSPDQLMDEDENQDGYWNIGERLVYSEYNITDLRVEALIVDKISDSILLWGVLQDGDIINNPGGIWHFNDSTGDTAVEVLNDNTGYLTPDDFLGPQWDLEEIADGDSSLRFDGVNDYVRVHGDSVSLDIIDEITVESWIKLPEDYVLNNFKYGPNFGYEPDVIQVSDNIYAIAYRDQKETGVLKSVSIYPDGTIIDNVHNNSLEFGDKCYWPKIIHISDEIYLIAYSQSDTNPKIVVLKTVKMLDNGTTIGVIGEFSFEPKEVYEYELLQIADNLSVIIYRDSNGYGVVRSINTSDNCSIINASLTNGLLCFENDTCNEPTICHVSNETYAIAYRGSGDHGCLKTVNITDEGVIEDQVIDDFIFDLLNESYESQMLHVINNTYAIVYRDNDENGYITTVEIYENGTINKSVIDTMIFEDDYCLLPDITYISDDIFLVAYENDQMDGYVAVVKILDNGMIEMLDKFQYNTKKNYFGIEPDIFRVSDDVFGIAFRSGSHTGAPHEGHLITGGLSNFIDSGDSNTLGPGIVYREGIYGIFVNKTHISATIGENVVSTEMLFTSEDWIHIVLTYDGSIMRLYINGNEETSGFYENALATSSNDIYFGRSFYGFIDEIGIFGRALTSGEIQYHFNNPGELESVLS